MRIITLITDFGLKDGNVGVMKGVILGIAPQVQIVDLSHLISPQNILEAGLILRRSMAYFSPGTIHTVVVDPGVGTQRRPLAAKLGDQFFVGPDNGVITQVLEHLEQVNEESVFVHLNNPQYWLSEVSHVFHGRDIFAPVAAHLARGVLLNDLGVQMVDPVRVELPIPVTLSDGLKGEVIHIDHFGNIATNIRYEHLGARRDVTVDLCAATIHGMINTFGERSPGALVALFGSTGNLIVSVVNGSAAQQLGAKVGDPVMVAYD